MVGEKGLEPSHLAAHAPKACVSTISPLARQFNTLDDTIFLIISRDKR